MQLFYKNLKYGENLIGYIFLLSAMTVLTLSILRLRQVSWFSAPSTDAHEITKIDVSYSHSPWFSVIGFSRIELKATSRPRVNCCICGWPEYAILVIFRRGVWIICVR